MGFMGELFGGHPHEEVAQAPVVATPEQPAHSDNDGSHETPPAAEHGHEDLVKPAGMTTVTEGGPAPVDLRDVHVDPAETPEADPEAATKSTAEAEAASSADQGVDTEVTPEPVSAGEFSTAVKVNIDGLESSSEESNNSDEAVPAKSATEESQAAETTGNDVVESDDSALDKLKEWQKSDAVGGADKSSEEVEPAAEPETPSGETQDITESAPSAVEAADTAQADTEPDSESDSEQPDDYAAKLEAEAADEVAEIDKAKEEADAAAAESKPEIQAVGSEIAAETSEEDEPAQTEATTELPVQEDTPFPELAADEESEKSESADFGGTEVEAAPATEEKSTIGGADVHLDRAEYVIPESAKEELETAASDTRSGETTGAEVITLSTERRAELETSAANLEKTAQSIRDLLDRAA